MTRTISMRSTTTMMTTLGLALGLAACQPTGSTTSGSTSTAPSAQTSSPAAPSSGLASPSETPSTGGTASTPGGAAQGESTATGTSSKVTFSLPAGFKVFDRDALQDDTRLAELSRITGVPADKLRLPSPQMDLNAVSLAKESGGTTNILLFGSEGRTAIPDEAQAKDLIAQTGSTYVGYRTTTTKLGQAALIESTDPAAGGGTVTHIDIHVAGGGTSMAQFTVTSTTAKRANEVADLVASSVHAAD